ncbi:MAG: hypothetical protein LW832_09160 [Parachlamydia sp.]|jgi:3-hydroxyacyl-[acyl-carrier-protein] dehydratase|nr:hypothetical protein [Parachlamydia sp.]
MQQISTLKTLDINQILQVLPHRYPFLLVDRVLEIDLEKGYVLAQKMSVSMNPSFKATFHRHLLCQAS